MQTSTLPALSSGPLTKRTVPLVQFWTAVGRNNCLHMLILYSALSLLCCLASTRIENVHKGVAK